MLFIRAKVVSFTDTITRLTTCLIQTVYVGHVHCVLCTTGEPLIKQESTVLLLPHSSQAMDMKRQYLYHRSNNQVNKDYYFERCIHGSFV